MVRRSNGSSFGRRKSTGTRENTMNRTDPTVKVMRNGGDRRITTKTAHRMPSNCVILRVEVLSQPEPVRPAGKKRTTPMAGKRLARLAEKHRPPQKWYDETTDPFVPAD
jgi:hypothetical protein